MEDDSLLFSETLKTLSAEQQLWPSPLNMNKANEHQTANHGETSAKSYKQVRSRGEQLRPQTQRTRCSALVACAKADSDALSDNDEATNYFEAQACHERLTTN